MTKNQAVLIAIAMHAVAVEKDGAYVVLITDPHNHQSGHIVEISSDCVRYFRNREEWASHETNNEIKFPKVIGFVV